MNKANETKTLIVTETLRYEFTVRQDEGLEVGGAFQADLGRVVFEELTLEGRFAVRRGPGALLGKKRGNEEQDPKGKQGDQEQSHRPEISGARLGKQAGCAGGPRFRRPSYPAADGPLAEGMRITRVRGRR